MGDEMPNWPADKIERRKVADLIPYARNARTHSDEQVAQIAASINEPWHFCVENDCYAAGESGTIYRVCRRQKTRSGGVSSVYETIRLQGSVDKDGYRVYRMMVDGVKKHTKGHRLVAAAFLGANESLVVNHKDGKKQNNSIQNIEWVTVAENNAHAIETGLVDPHKPNDKNRKVLISDYATIHALHKMFGFSRADIAKINKCSRQTIDKAINAVEDVFKGIGYVV
jgi:hypothetical protein